MQHGTHLSQADGSRRFWIARDVFVCAAQTAVVFLDLAGDKFTGVDYETAGSLSAAVNWPTHVMDRIAPHYTSTSPNPERLSELVAKGLLVTTPSESATQCSHAYVLPLARSEISIGAEFSAHISTLDIARFVYSCTLTRIELKRHALQSLASAVCRARQRFGSRTREVTRAELSDRVGTFRRLRVYAFSAENQCLFHSLALFRFLSLCRIAPSWVIGVKTNPWGAHSWLQCGDCVLDDSPERTLKYDPILIL